MVNNYFQYLNFSDVLLCLACFISSMPKPANTGILQTLVDTINNVTVGSHLLLTFRHIQLCRDNNDTKPYDTFHEFDIHKESKVNNLSFKSCRVCSGECKSHTKHPETCHSIITSRSANGTGHEIMELQIRHEPELTDYIYLKISNVCQAQINCSQLTQSDKHCPRGYKHGPPKGTTWPLVEDIALLLSLLCLCFTMFIHLALPELRNLHGKNLCSFVGAMFISQMFMFHDFGIEDRDICIAIAVILQYFWLAVFAWTSVLAFDIARTFNAYRVLKTRPHREYSRRFGIYCIAGWGLPLLLTSTSYLVTDKLFNNQYAYGRVPGCFPDFFIAIYIMGIPLFISSVFNCVCFGIIIYGIESHRKKAAFATTLRLKKRKGERFKCIFYAKLSIVCGSAWIIFFMVHFFGDMFRHMTAMLLNFQGILIFLSTVLFNRRAIIAVKRRMSRQESGPPDERGSVSTISKN